jgi:hypothetical protein
VVCACYALACFVDSDLCEDCLLVLGTWLASGDQGEYDVRENSVSCSCLYHQLQRWKWRH